MPGATSFEFLRTVNGQLFPTFAEAASARHLLDDEREWEACLEEAVSYQMPRQLRQLFAFMIISAGVHMDANKLWMKYKDKLCEDLCAHNKRSKQAAEALAFSFIKKILIANGVQYDELQLPPVPHLPPDEQQFSDADHKRLIWQMEPTLNADQRHCQFFHGHVSEPKCCSPTVFSRRRCRHWQDLCV